MQTFSVRMHKKLKMELLLRREAMVARGWGCKGNISPSPFEFWNVWIYFKWKNGWNLFLFLKSFQNPWTVSSESWELSYPFGEIINWYNLRGGEGMALSNAYKICKYVHYLWKNPPEAGNPNCFWERNLWKWRLRIEERLTSLIYAFFTVWSFHTELVLPFQKENN